MKDSLVEGLSITQRWTIDRERTIDFMGEDLRLYGTPWLVRDIELTSRMLLVDHFDEGEDTVGTGIDLQHMGATVLDMWVDITVTVVEVEGRRIVLEVEASDALEQVGKARHTRFVIDTERQKTRIQAKLEKIKEMGAS